MSYCNLLPNDKILDWTKLKAFGDIELIFHKMIISAFDRVKKHCGKRRKCWLPAFSPFPTMFSKAFFFGVVKSRDCLVKSKCISMIHHIKEVTTKYGSINIHFVQQPTR